MSRDTINLPRANGRLAALIGRKKSDCPYAEGPNRREWLEGYDSIPYDRRGCYAE